MERGLALVLALAVVGAQARPAPRAERPSCCPPDCPQEPADQAPCCQLAPAPPVERLAWRGLDLQPAAAVAAPQASAHAAASSPPADPEPVSPPPGPPRVHSGLSPPVPA